MADVANLNLKIGADVSAATAGLTKVQQGLAATAVAAGKVDSSLQKTSQVTGTAALALNNLGRVAQDLPYGFIGIANNLNPLLEGFQRLAVQSKAAGVSMGTTLLNSLKGAGGIGLALSAVTAAVTFASIGLQAWGASAKSSSKDIDEAADSAKRLSDAIKTINESAAGELTKVKELVSGYNEANVSHREKIGIIKELKQISPEYFGQLNAEKTSIGELKTAYDNYNKSIVSSIKTKIFSKQLEELVKGELEFRQALENNNKLLNLRAGFKLKNEGGVDPGLEKIKGASNLIENDLNRNLAEQGKLLEKINDAGGIDAIFNFSEPKAAKAKNVVEEITALYRKLPIVLAATTIPDFSKPIQRALDREPAIKVNMAFGVDPKIKINEDAIKDQAAGINAIISTTLQDAFSSIGEGLAGGNLFSGIFQVLAKGLETLGKFLIETAIIVGKIKAAINAAIVGPGGIGVPLAIGLGVGLIALGKSIENRIPKLAAGGIVTRPTNALIGESGPEAVIPLGRMQGLLADNSGTATIRLVAQGKDLVAVINRQTLSNNRNLGSNF